MRRVLCILIVLLVALIHIIGAGKWFHGSYRDLYSSYFSDIAVPFAFYFLLCVAERNWPWVAGWKMKAVILLGGCVLAESLQYFHVHFLGTVFDPLDVIAYIIGIAAAIVVDELLLQRLKKSGHANA